MGYQEFARDTANASRVSVGQQSPIDGISGAIKRGLDIVLSGLGIIVLFPILLPIALMIRSHDGGPALFKQRRIGLDGREFECWKFRTMVVDAKEQLARLLDSDPEARKQWAESQKLDHDPRITKLGNFLRKSSIDELPQLINIFRGEMSIVGPRPIVQNEAEKYGANFDDYCSVRPGLTGLWQVSGRSNTSYAQRVALDVRYVENWSNLGDVSIIIRTIPAVLFSNGAR